MKAEPEVEIRVETSKTTTTIRWLLVTKVRLELKTQTIMHRMLLKMSRTPRCEGGAYFVML
jgi:hypothetical protein